MGLRALASRSLFAGLGFIVLMGVTAAPAQATPRGELVATTYSNGIGIGPKCGSYTIKFFNASTAVILEARVLVNVVTDFDTRKQAPYRGSAKRSWVVFKTYMKPGATTFGELNLCSTVRLTGEERDFTSFDVGKVRWKWA